MMEKAATNWYAMSDPALLGLLGHFVQQTRLQQNKTQQQVATAAGVNRSTVVQAEKGGGTMLSFIQILRALGQLHLFENFVIQQQQPSPLQLAKAEQQKRQRASGPQGNTIKKPISNW